MKIQDMTPGRPAFKPTKSELYDWLDKHILCVISTIGEGGYPNSATVAFSQTEDLQFFIMTDEASRKAKNIERDSRVAMTITNEDDRYTVQLEGDAKIVSWDEFKPYETRHFKKLPNSLPFRDLPGQTPILINPTHIRFSDVSVRPWGITEY